MKIVMFLLLLHNVIRTVDNCILQETLLSYYLHRTHSKSLAYRPIIYVSVFEYALNKFIVRTNFKPCLTGADTVYIMNEESKFTNNPLYSSLDTVYFLSEDYPSYDQRTIPIFHRKLQMNSDYVNKLTIALYTNLETKTLYQNHNRKWFIDIVVSGWI